MSAILAVGKNQFEWTGVEVTHYGGDFIDLAENLHTIFWKVYDCHILRMCIDLIIDRKNGWDRITTEFPAVSVQQRGVMRKWWLENPTDKMPNPATYYTLTVSIYAQGDQPRTWYENANKLFLIDEDTRMVFMYWIEKSDQLEYYGCFDITGPEFLVQTFEGEI